MSHNSGCMNGVFISFEGIDGAGKSSHIQALAQAWEAKLKPGQQLVLTREPGGTPLAERLREMVLHEAMDPLTEALLVFAARREHIVKVIAPALARGDVVLCDRFTDASFAYQGSGRQFDWNLLSFLEQSAQNLRGLEADLALRSDETARVLQPDLTLLFDVPPEVAAQRLAQARQPDRFESQDTAFFARVRQGYEARIAADPGRFVRIDGHQSLDKVRADVMAALAARGF